MKQIIFTVLNGEETLIIKTMSFLADDEDKNIITYTRNLFHLMLRLTEKYNNRNIAVLFEVD